MKSFRFFRVLVVAVCACSLSEAKQPHRKVLILGAGLSGIVAGKTLQDNSVDDFLVLEGQDYVGGRIKQVPFAGFKVEEGANFIHSFNDPATAPLWKLKILKEVRGIIRSGSFAIRNESGSRITDMTDLQKLVKVMMMIEKTQENDEVNKLSARKGLETLGWSPKTPLQYAFEWWMIDFSYAEKAENIAFSALEYGDDEDFLVGDQRGMMELYRDFYKGFKDKIKLNSTVVGIHYNSSFVEVKLSNGEVYTADYVLCTFSTGVLSSDMVQFTPSLPQWKKKAISEKPLATFTKIFLKFPKRFWEDKDDILMVNSKRGYYPVNLNLDTQGLLKGSGLMLLIVTGDEAKRIENQSLNQTKQEIIKVLKGIYGSNFTEPTGIHYTRWSKNPFVRGSYSEGIVGFSASKNHKDMAKNLGKLYFSGEATSEYWYGYMQGAYMTGETQAQAIAKAIKCDEDKTKCPVNRTARFESAGLVFIVTQLCLHWYAYYW